MKSIITVICSFAVAFTSGVSCGILLERPRNTGEALAMAARHIEMDLMGNRNFTQAHLNTASACLVQVAKMRCGWQELEICNRPGYEKIEAEFLKDVTKWERLLTEEEQKASRYEGGSAAPLDCHLRRYDVLRGRFDEMRQKYCK